MARSRKAPAKRSRSAAPRPRSRSIVKRPRSRSAAKAPRSIWSGLAPGPANFTPLSPIVFLPRAAEVHPERIAVIHGAARYTYAHTYARARRLAAALARA
jgi:non-ribosomal peptide synthetase component F